MSANSYISLVIVITIYAISLIFIPASADVSNLLKTTDQIIDRDFYMSVKLIFLFFFIIILYLISHNFLLSSVLITSPLFLALFGREGFDFLSTIPLLLLIPRFQRFNIIIILTSSSLYFLVQEISIIFVLMCALAVQIISSKNIHIKSLVMGFFVVAISGVLFHGYVVEILFESIIKKIATTEITHQRNSDFNLIKAYIVLFLSHSFFIFSDYQAVVFAAFTSPIIVGVITLYSKRVFTRKFTLSLIMYSSIVWFFKTFQHLRIHPQIFVLSLVQLKKRGLQILLLINLITVVLHSTYYTFNDCLECGFRLIWGYDI